MIWKPFAQRSAVLLLPAALVSAACGTARQPTVFSGFQNLSGNPLARLPEANIKDTVLPDGEVQITLTGEGALFYTLDGTIPVPSQSDTAENTAASTLRYSQPFTVSKNTIVRMVSASESRQSVVRSALVVPRIWDVTLAQVPAVSKPIKAVYVTGPFRNWSTAFEDRFKLSPSQDGSFSGRILIDRDSAIDYKFILRYEDESFEWALDVAKPTVGQAPYDNHQLAAPRAELAGQFLGRNDGVLDEAALDLTFTPVAALDAGDNLIRVKVGFLDNDVEKVNVRFASGALKGFELTKESTYTVDGVPFANYAGLVRLPAGSVESRFVFEAGDRENIFLLGPKGIVLDDPFGARGSSFPFSYDAQTRRLNGAELYQIPLWSVDTTWYQIFPERFRNGDTSNDVLGDYPTEWAPSFSRLASVKRTISPWSGSWFSFTPFEKEMERIVRETQPELDPREVQRQVIFSRRYGGDLRGIRDQIKHLKSLGITGVYLNPVFESDSLHRYDTKDYRHVDADLGPMTRDASGRIVPLPEDLERLAREDVENPATWEYTTADKEFLRLVTELQDNGIRVAIDGVFNHSAANGPLVADVARKGKASRFYDWFAMSYEGDPNYAARKCQLAEFFPDAQAFPYASKIRFDSWAGFCPLINHRQGYPDGALHPGFRKYVFDVMERWLAPKTVDGIKYRGVDAIRLDVYGEVPSDFWRLFRKKVKELKPETLIVAEEWYDGFHLLKGDEADGLMNYTARTLAESWFINTDPAQRFRPSWARGYVDDRMNAHREHVKHGLWTMLSSHDTDRVISKTLMPNRSLVSKPHEGNSWDADVANKPDRGAPFSNDKPGVLEREFFKGIVAFQMSYMGAPVIYYGDEIGMWGADDPTDRKPMVWDDLARGQFETQCVTQPGTWCLENPTVRFSVEQDKDMLATYQRLVAARNRHPALRRGKMNTAVPVVINGRDTILGAPENDDSYLWGYERNFGDRNFAYFISNQNINVPSQTLSIKTKFKPNRPVRELVTGQSYRMNEGGVVNVTLSRDRALLFVQE